MDILFILPVEITSLVVDLLDRESLVCLRLVCKEAQHIATPTFGRKYLHTLRPIFSPECLSALVEISENSLLRGYVRRILFASYVLKQSIPRGGMILDSHRPEVRERMLAAHKHCIEKQQQLIKSGRDIELIAQAFANFKDNGVPLVLGIFDNQHTQSNGRTYHIYKGWTADPFYNEIFGLDAWVRDSGNVLETVIKAANFCNYPLESIGMDLCEALTFPMGIKELLRPGETPVDQVLANILSDASCGNSKLSFHFNIVPMNGNYMSCHLSIDVQDRRFSCQSLQRSQKTKFARSVGLAALGKLASDLGTNFLREIAVSRCEADVFYVSRLLRGQSGTLQRLKLSQIVFSGMLRRQQVHGSMHAAGFLGMLKDELKHLEYLELEDLKGSDSDRGMLPISTVRIKSEGRQDIESDLNLCLQSPGITGEQQN
ncbi:hypothetical protein KCU64_g3115, partial [Aureobasidium melanogenum]